MENAHQVREISVCTNQALWSWLLQIDGLVQERRNSIANALAFKSFLH